MGSGEAASFGLVGRGPVTIPQTLVALFCLCNLPGIPLLSWRAVDWNRLGPARWDLNSLFFSPGSPEFPCLLGECVPGAGGWVGKGRSLPLEGGACALQVSLFVASAGLELRVG